MNLRTISKTVQRGEELLLALLLTAMAGLSCIQIFLRLFFDSGLIWIDPLLRSLVVWSGLLGAMLAVSRNKHISIDISEHLLPENVLTPLRILIQIFSCCVCAFLTYASLLFLQSEMEFGGTFLLALPAWIWNLIFPFAFAVMACRFLFAAVAETLTLLSTTSEDSSP
ncbi:MAG: TRAP transporter small permease [Desulfopila sp.]|jgi:TRAP-type C4-dicarboxylate transport system permease small subunit|nr:TRAP transporter small permease [Desulfopila sp.]